MYFPGMSGGGGGGDTAGLSDDEAAMVRTVSIRPSDEKSRGLTSWDGRCKELWRLVHSKQ